MSQIDPQLAYEITHEANTVLLERNRRLVEAPGDMLTLEPTAEQRARATEVWQREHGVPT